MKDVEKFLSAVGEVIDSAKTSVIKFEDVYDKPFLHSDHVPYTGSILGLDKNPIFDNEDYFKDVEHIISYYKTKGTDQGLAYLMKKFNIGITFVPLWTADV